MKHKDWVVLLQDPGKGYRAKYQRKRALSDLELAIRLSQMTLDLTRVDHPARAGRLQSIVIVYRLK
jgi:hypothetical protein